MLDRKIWPVETSPAKMKENAAVYVLHILEKLERYCFTLVCTSIEFELRKFLHLDRIELYVPSWPSLWACHVSALLSWALFSFGLPWTIIIFYAIESVDRRAPLIWRFPSSQLSPIAFHWVISFCDTLGALCDSPSSSSPGLFTWNFPMWGHSTFLIMAVSDVATNWSALNLA